MKIGVVKFRACHRRIAHLGTIAFRTEHKKTLGRGE
jgi:hypothetical protein